MTSQKRAFDLVMAVILLIILSPLILVISIFILLVEGRPVFYISERMRTIDQSFPFIKFRTMTPALENAGVSGGDKSGRITNIGHFLRNTRLDELPQLINIILGHMSFVGPRPPLRQYVQRAPALYAEVLKSRPGVTGLATICYHRHEEKLLLQCKSPDQTDRVYMRSCVPRKARLDLIYQEHQSFCFDIMLISKTALKLLKR